MNLNNIYVSGELEEKEIVFAGETLKIKVRPVTYSMKTTILHNCLRYNKKQEATFNHGQYIEDMLMAMIVEAPWGVTDRSFFKRLKPEFGAELEKLVPHPQESSDDEDFFDGT